MSDFDISTSKVSPQGPGVLREVTAVPELCREAKAPLLRHVASFHSVLSRGGQDAASWGGAELSLVYPRPGIWEGDTLLRRPCSFRKKRQLKETQRRAKRRRAEEASGEGRVP